jgi:DNA modification methylase
VSSPAVGSNKSPFRHELNARAVPIERLRPFSRQVRRYTAAQTRKLARSIDTFGFVLPILIDETDRVVGGWALVLAAKRLGLMEIPAITVTDLSESELRALRLALNRLSEDGAWDKQELAFELKELIDLGFEIDLTGFEIAEIDLIIEEHGDGLGEEQGAEDAVVEANRDQAAVTGSGDLWRLGQHLLLCGDARDPGSYAALLGEEESRLVFTDPPYNVPILGHASGLGRIKHAEFAMAAGEMTEEAYVDFLQTTLSCMGDALVHGGIAFVCIDWRHVEQAIRASKSARLTLKNICVWVKTNGGMGTFYRSRHEFILVLKKGDGPHVNSFGLGETGRYRTNVWEYAGVNTFRSGRLEELAWHPTVKPTALVADAIKDCSRRRDLILDPFAGSGTTIIAAEKTGRRARVMEIDPHYCDVIVRRWQAYTGKSAVHAATGLSFEEIEAKRGTTNEIEEMQR